MQKKNCSGARSGVLEAAAFRGFDAMGHRVRREDLHSRLREALNAEEITNLLYLMKNLKVTILNSRTLSVEANLNQKIPGLIIATLR
jgi:hypothetical protein